MTSVVSPLPVEKGFAVPLPFSFASPIPLGATVGIVVAVGQREGT